MNLFSGAFCRRGGFRPDLRPGHCIWLRVPECRYQDLGSLALQVWDITSFTATTAFCSWLFNQNFLHLSFCAQMRRGGCTAAPCWLLESACSASDLHSSASSSAGLWECLLSAGASPTESHPHIVCSRQERGQTGDATAASKRH